MVGNVGAKPTRPIGGRERSPAAAILPCEGAQNGEVWEVAKKVSAALAAGILEVEQLAAMLALEKLHRPVLIVDSAPADIRSTTFSL